MNFALNARSASIDFICGAAGRLLVSYHPPAGYKSAPRNVIIVPPFAEELPKARRMMALQARCLASLGVGVLIPDLFGTGDSEGDFAEARWETWQRDLRCAAAWLREQQRARISLLGLRLGALLALDVARRLLDDIEKIVLWSPIVRGDVAVREFLKLRLAARVSGHHSGSESIEDLRRTLASGRSVEIAGYELASELVYAIERLDAKTLGPGISAPIHWVELLLDPGQPFPRVSHEVTNGWRAQGVSITTATVIGAPFWAGGSTTIVPELLSLTAKIFVNDQD